MVAGKAAVALVGKVDPMTLPALADSTVAAIQTWREWHQPPCVL